MSKTVLVTIHLEYIPGTAQAVAVWKGTCLELNVCAVCKDPADALRDTVAKAKRTLDYCLTTGRDLDRQRAPQEYWERAQGCFSEPFLLAKVPILWLGEVEEDSLGKFDLSRYTPPGVYA